MRVNLHCHSAKIETADQYKVNVQCNMKRTDFQKTLYYLVKTDPSLWNMINKIRDSLDDKGFE